MRRGRWERDNHHECRGGEPSACPGADRMVVSKLSGERSRTEITEIKDMQSSIDSAGWIQRRELAGAVAEAGRRPVAGPFLRRQPSPVAGSRRASGRAPPGEPGRLRRAMTPPRRLVSKLVSISLGFHTRTGEPALRLLEAGGGRVPKVCPLGEFDLLTRAALSQRGMSSRTNPERLRTSLKNRATSGDARKNRAILS